MANTQLPASPPQTPGFPQSPQAVTFEGFSSWNTKPTRPAIEDQQAYIMQNFHPLGPSNLRTMWGPGSALYTASGKTIVDYHFGNLGSTPYVYVLQSDGSIEQVGTSTSLTTAVAPAGTITSPTNDWEVSQWGSQYILMVAPQTNGYFIWDGTSFYQAGSLGPVATFVNAGADYTSAPTVTLYGGSGSGATVTATVLNNSVVSLTVTNPGSNYVSGDVVGLLFNGGGSKTSAHLTASITAGSVSTIVITAAGSGYTQATTKAVILGGGGSGATASITISSGSVSAVSITANGTGYTTAPTVIVEDSANPVAQAYFVTMPFGVSGNTIETYQSRVWIANGPKVQFSAPSSPSDFNASDGAGAFQSNDSFLRTQFTKLIQSNGFLYLIGDSSMNYISGVSTSGTPPVTTFTNQNVDPQIGSPWHNTVQVYSRNIVFGNTFGVHVSYGGAVTKVSEMLDGIYPSVPTSSWGSFLPSSAVATLFGIQVYMMLFPVIDQITGSQTNELLCWDGKRWWNATQGSIALTYIQAQEINSVLTAWGTDGTSIYPLFNAPSKTLTKTVQSKLWDRPGYFYQKNATRLFGVVDYTDPTNGAITVDIDNETGSNPYVVSNIEPTMANWVNNSGASVSWTNNSSQPVIWFTSGLGFFPYAIGQHGQYLGMTLSTQADDMTLISLTMIEQVWQTNI